MIKDMVYSEAVEKENFSVDNIFAKIKGWPITPPQSHVVRNPKWAACTVDKAEFCNWAGLPKDTGSKSAANKAATQPTAPTGGADADTLKKQLAVLALLLADKQGRFKRGKKPNALQIAEAAQDVLNAIEGAGIEIERRGLSIDSIRQNIGDGLILLDVNE